MSHWSEESRRLLISWQVATKTKAIDECAPEPGTVVLLVPPHGRRTADVECSASYYERIRALARRLRESDLLCVLTSPEDAVATYLAVGEELHFQLWVAVKLALSIDSLRGFPHHHAALLILSRYPGTLRHTKTRLAYSYCPACDKTTKDYGGKKHTYHEYGTLMSDVWRDMAWDPCGTLEEIGVRLADLFGLAPHEKLHILDIRSARSLRPKGDEPLPQHLARGGRLNVDRHAGGRLILGDCLTELRKLDSESVDFCFADPPYNLEKQYDSWRDDLAVSAYFDWCDKWLKELARVVKPGGTVAVLNIPLWAIRHFAPLNESLAFQNWIVWEGLGLPVRMIMPAHYAILCFQKPPFRVPPGRLLNTLNAQDKQAVRCAAENFCSRALCKAARNREGIRDWAWATDLWWDIHRLKHNSRRADHPCQLPPSLMRRLIAFFTKPGETVLDPFNGVGTTTLVAELMGRQSIGIELSEKYHLIAGQRHLHLRQGRDPFAKSGAVPSAKNSRVRRLEKRKYTVPKKVLQLEVRDIAKRLGHMPSRDDVARLSRYPIAYFEEYFVSWGEVCAAARTTGMTEHRDRSRRQEAEQPTLF